MMNKQKTMELIEEVAPVREPYSAPAYELFRFETDGLIQVSGNVGDNTKDVPEEEEEDWSNE